jgi:hypothetical protein
MVVVCMSAMGHAMIRATDHAKELVMHRANGNHRIIKVFPKAVIRLKVIT